MTLKERYASTTIEGLINIIENKNDYTLECIDVVVQELKTRPLDKESVEKIAKDIIKSKFTEFLTKFDPTNSEIIIFESNFISKDQVIEIQKQEFDKWMENRESLDYDVWKFAAGTI